MINRSSTRWTPIYEAAAAVAACFALLPLSFDAAAASDSGDAARPAGKSAITAAGDPSTAHLKSLQTLQKVAAAKAGIMEAITRNDIAALTQLHKDLKEQIVAARVLMDDALLLGAWRPSAIKKDAASLRSRLESVELLNFIVLAQLTGYEHPTKNVPASAKDANARLFAQLDSVLAEQTALNSKVTQLPRTASQVSR